MTQAVVTHSGRAGCAGTRDLLLVPGGRADLSVGNRALPGIRPELGGGAT